MRTGRAPHREPLWGRRKLLALLGVVLISVVLVVLGIGLAIFYALQPPHRSTAVAGVSARPSVTATGGAAAGASSAERSQQDALAAAPMPRVGLEASRPGPISARDPGVILLPSPTGAGPVGVPTGFPHSPAGALAQLAAIDQTAMQSGSLVGVRSVIAGWAAPGGPTPASWSAVSAMADFLDAAGLSGAGSPQLTLIVTPSMGLIKGNIGTDFVVACVDFEFDATVTQTQRVAAADCQRMVWLADRWLIGPGAEPALAPSVWPDTDTAITVGYRDLRRG